MRTVGVWMAIASALALLPACKRDACSATTLEKFTPSSGLVLSRVHVEGHGQVERDVWTGTEVCGPPETDTTCESRARLVAGQHMPKGGDFKLSRGKIGDPDKWRGSYRASTSFRVALPRIDLGVFPTSGDCMLAMSKIPKGFTPGACELKPAQNGEPSKWVGSYQRAMVASDFPVVADAALPPEHEVGIFDTLEQCQTATTAVASADRVTSCAPAGAWTYEVRAFVREGTGAVQHTMNLSWSPPSDVSFDAAMGTLRDDVRSANLVIVTEPAKPGGVVVIGCP